MNVAKQTNSPSSIRNKKQKCGLVPLLGLLLNNGKEFTGSYIKKLVELLTIEKMSSLLTACKEIYQATEIILYYAPKVWDNDTEVRKMFVAMTEAPNSRWMTSWIDTRKVEQMALGSNSRIQGTAVVTDERFKRFIEQFPRLTSMNLSRCDNITDVSVIEIAKGCPQLTSINLSSCGYITNTSVFEIAKGCSQLTSIDLSCCRNITDESVIEIAKGCSQLTSINLSNCDNITDASIIEIAKGCSQLTSIKLSWCRNITDASIIEIAKGCSQLTSIDLNGCYKITDTSLNVLKNEANPDIVV
jgi:hypothetical protein